MQWEHPGLPHPKKANVDSSAGKVMVSVFWDAKGIVLINYLKKAELLTRNIMPICWSSCEMQLRLNGPENWQKGVWFHQDNAPTPKSVVAMAAVHASHFSTFLVFTGLSSSRLFSVSEHEKAPSWETLPVRRGDSCYGGVFQGQRWGLLYQRDRRSPSIAGGSVWTERATMLKISLSLGK